MKIWKDMRPVKGEKLFPALLKKDKREERPFNIMAIMHFDSFSFTARVSRLR